MNPNILKRYTDLPAVIDLLMNGRVTLLDPMIWEDKNDSFYLSVYKERKRLRTLLALCFTQEAETYHHWKVFSGHTGGVCIVFKKDELLADFSNESGIRHQNVEYLLLNKIKLSPPTVQTLPFIKRNAFKHENEFRIIYENSEEALSAFPLKIRLECIDRVLLSPWMPAPLADATRKLLRKIDGCSKLKVNHSTLINNEQWKKIGSDVSIEF